MATLRKQDITNPPNDEHTNVSFKGLKSQKNVIAQSNVSPKPFTFPTMLSAISQEDSHLRLSGLKFLEIELREAFSIYSGAKVDYEIKQNDELFLAGLYKSIDFIIQALLSYFVEEDSPSTLLATQCLNLILCLLITLNSKDFSVRNFFDVIVEHGFKSPNSTEYKFSLCKALPVILDSEPVANKSTLKHSAFEPLLKCLVELGWSGSDLYTHVQLAFSSVLDKIGYSAFCEIINNWKKNEDTSFIRNQVELALKWSNNVFRGSDISESCTHDEQLTIEEYRDEDYHLTEDEGSDELIDGLDSDQSDSPGDDDTLSIEDDFPFRYADIEFMLPKETYDSVSFCCQSSSLFFSPLTNPAIAHASVTYDPRIAHQGAEAMRDAVLAALNSPRRSAKLLGFVSSSFDITDSTASDSVRAGVTSSVPLKTRALHCLISLLIRLVTDANFNVVLCSLDIGTKIITFLAKHARNIHLLEPSKIAMFNWISLRMLRMVRIALTDSKLVVRVAGSKLAMAVARLPGGGMILAKQLAGRALLDAYRYQQIISRTNASVSTF